MRTYIVQRIPNFGTSWNFGTEFTTQPPYRLGRRSPCAWDRAAGNGWVDRNYTLVEDTLLCLKYHVKMKRNKYSVCQNNLFILLFHLLATRFGLTRPSSGQYL